MRNIVSDEELARHAFEKTDNELDKIRKIRREQRLKLERQERQERQGKQGQRGYRKRYIATDEDLIKKWIRE